MTKRLLIDATQPEETRVALVENDRLDSYDFDSAVRQQIKGNIFLAKVTRVEPSLQACFVEYGGNRQGFLAFTEIHPDYYKIPVEDRQALLAEEASWDDNGDDEDDTDESDDDAEDIADEEEEQEEGENGKSDAPAAKPRRRHIAKKTISKKTVSKKPSAKAAAAKNSDKVSDNASGEEAADRLDADESSINDHDDMPQNLADNLTEVDRDNTIEQIGGGEEESNQRDHTRRMGRLRRRYKIQEVIKRRQIILVQATKEERGQKGAAMTTYISLPGRYCVLMPNSPRGGGVSRKITDPQARRKMKDLLTELELPQGMSVILRTAGMTRTRLEIKRDLEYLLRLWDEIRRETMQSVAPSMVYEEADIFKRVIRDLYNRDTQEIIVSGEEGFKKLKLYMHQMVPTHAKKVLYYRDPLIPLFQRYQIESQIADVFNPRVELKSGGYIIINPTEALVSIDVNSGRATRERHIDDTALKTNIEAAEEIARQLRLRDLGGLVVIDFIDMESNRHNAKVERRLRDAMAEDRARIEIGRISGFGLLELSRQRLHPSLTETHYETCPHCAGTGLIRTTDSAAVVVIRAIEAEAVKGRAVQIVAHIPQHVAIYILNHKREEVNRIEDYFGCRVSLRADENLRADEVNLTYEKGTPTPRRQVELLPVPVLDLPEIVVHDEEDDGEPLMSQGPRASRNDADSDDGDEGDENGRNSRGGKRRRGGRGRNTPAWQERRDKNAKDTQGNGARDGAAVVIPIVDGNATADDAESLAVSNPTTNEKTEGRARRGNRRGGRHPYRRRQNGERVQAGISTGSDSANDLSDKNVHVGTQSVSAKPLARADNGASRVTESAGDSQGDGQGNKRGWWQRLIE